MDSIRWATEDEKQLTWSCSINAWFNICGSFSAITSSDDHTAKILGTPITVGGCSNSCRLNWINRDTNICPHRKLKRTTDHDRSPWTISSPQRDRDPIERRSTDNRRFEILIQCVISRSRAERDVKNLSSRWKKKHRSTYSCKMHVEPILIKTIAAWHCVHSWIRSSSVSHFLIIGSAPCRRVRLNNWSIDH